jgi:hypothetical protein
VSKKYNVAIEKQIEESIVQKAGFFETIARSGPMPRKSFSMGEAEEKRFYIECRKLFQG